jgi:hypothetical protein
MPVAWAAAFALGCAGSITPDSSESDSPLAQRVSRASVDGDALRGGRLYDKFYAENAAIGFSPDDADTPSSADGRGGPLGDGTLLDGTGAILDNAGHDFRLKNFFGWDLRGTDGVYGPSYQDKDHVAPYNLIDGSLTRQQIAELFVEGAPDVPAYGRVLPERDLSDLVAFTVAVSEHELPRPDDIWDLNPGAPKGYSLKQGARVGAGHGVIAQACGASSCHGSDGTNLMFDDGEFSLGSLSRGNAYEVWFKVVVGNPGSPMTSQIAASEPWNVQAQMVLDVLAALCDRHAYPLGSGSEPDVPAGDPRCAQYLR